VGKVKPSNCVVCGKPLTKWVKFKRLFWSPWGCSISFVWRYCCSPTCWEKALNGLIAEMEEQGD
jgi:hypothetical protein